MVEQAIDDERTDQIQGVALAYGVVVTADDVVAEGNTSHAIFIDSISLDISSFESFGMRWPEANTISGPLKSRSL